jgi:hypothetical protein
MVAGRKLLTVRDTDMKRLKTHYGSQLRPGPNDARLASALGLRMEQAIQLADQIFADLSTSAYGIGWWAAYPDLDRHSRIFLSDHLVACARTVSTNLIEAHVARLEFDHALDDFRAYMSRGIKNGTVVTPPPRGPYDDLAYFRVSGNFVGILRALGSALDCLAACLVGVAALPTPLVTTDLLKALEILERKHNNHSVLARLLVDIRQCEADAGPPGWIEWLLGMRNTDVHRGRRIVGYNVVLDARGDIEGFAMQLPRAPKLTEVEAWVDADGYVSAYFEAPADELITRVTNSVHTFIDGVAAQLVMLWDQRRADPGLMAQPAAQWKPPKTLITPLGRFAGYPRGSKALAGDVRGIAVSDEVLRRITAAGLTRKSSSDIHPSPDVWNQGP